jgi:uncharacterized protein (TIGR04255 family)
MAFPKFERPPVIELVCGVLFQSLPKFLTPHHGLLWEKFKQEYPVPREVVPLPPVVETFPDAPLAPPTPPTQWEEFPFFPRIWFERQDGTGLIQVQRDRFIHNWKKVRAEDEYPHYANVIKKFQAHLDTFESFLRENDLGTIKPMQYELTYVNHILMEEGWSSLKNMTNVFPDFQWRTEGKRFLAEYEGINYETYFRLPNRKGRLHAKIRHGIRKQDQHPILLLDLTARGIEENRSRKSMWDWFDMAHEWIVYGFADLTSLDIQKKNWGREDG